MDCIAIIELIGVLVSLLLGIASIVISVLTLNQNSKMIEESSRPNIAVYGKKIYIGITKYILIVKNFGSSSGTITDFKCDKNLKDYALIKDYNPFEHIIGTTLVPGQSIFCELSLKSLNTKNISGFSFTISYKGIKTYLNNKFIVNTKAETENIIGHTHAKDILSEKECLYVELKNISDTLNGIGEEISLK